MNQNSLEKLEVKILNGTMRERNDAFLELKELPFDSIRDFLFDGLRNNHHRIRSECAKILGEKGDETVIFTLLQTMGDDSWAIRNSAQEALKRLDEKKVLPSLDGIISSTSGNLSLLKSLASVLSEYKSPEASSLLVKILQNNSDASLVEVVTKSLGKRCDDLSLTHLFHLLANDQWDIRKAASRAIANIPIKQISERLKKELSNPNRFIHLAVVEILIANQNEDVIDLMADALSSNNDSTRINALNVLEGIGDDESFSLLISVLGDQNSSIRARTVEILGKSNSDTVIQMLKRCLKSRNAVIKKNSIKTLAKIGSDTAVEYLETFMEEAENDEKIMVLEALASIGSRKSIQLVIKNVSIPGFAEQIAEILKSLDPDLAIQQLVNLLEEQDFFATAVKALASLDSIKVLRYLSNKLTSGTPLQQQKAIEAMGLIGSQHAIPYLEKIIEGGFSKNLTPIAETSLRRLRKSTP